jgi:glycosyltransferase involved in cell wall biosynthesis
VSDSVRVSVVIGAHNEERILSGTVRAVVARLERHPGSEIIVVENGSTDGTLAIAQELAARCATPDVAVVITRSGKGLGRALRAGIALARGDVLLLTAADLPFGFTDLDAALALRPRPPLVLGSKAHPASTVEAKFGRRLMSSSARVLRRALLAVNVGDSQGSVFIDRELAERLLPDLVSDGYLMTTELVTRATYAGYSPVEVPIRYTNPRADSKVRPVRDSVAGVRAMLELRRVLGARGVNARAARLEAVPGGV